MSWPQDRAPKSLQAFAECTQGIAIMRCQPEVGLFLRVNRGRAGLPKAVGPATS